MDNNMIGSIRANGNVTNSNNNATNIVGDNSLNVIIKRVRQESVIISFVVGILASILGTCVCNYIF